MRIRKGYATLFLTFFFLTISSIMITSGRYSREQNEKLSRGYYTENAYNITVSGLGDEEEMLAWLRENPCRGCLVYRMGLSETTDFRGAAFDDEAELPSLREGRFFTSEESRSDERIVVAGEELLKNAVTKEGQKWLELSGAEYRVVGVLGKRSRSRLDSMAFVPLGAVVSLCGADGTYMVDGGEEEVRAACDAFRARWGDKVTGEEPAMHRSISVGDAEPEGTERVMNLNICCRYFLICAGRRFLHDVLDRVPQAALIGNVDSRLHRDGDDRMPAFFLAKGGYSRCGDGLRDRVCPVARGNSCGA